MLAVFLKGLYRNELCFQNLFKRGLHLGRLHAVSVDFYHVVCPPQHIQKPVFSATGNVPRAEKAFPVNSDECFFCF